MSCTYCGTLQGQAHKGFCLTNLERAREEWVVLSIPPTTEAPRCKALTFAGQPDHLLTRCSLDEGHPENNHLPSFSEADKNH